MTFTSCASGGRIMSSTWVGRPDDAQHPRHGEPVDVGVDDAHPQPRRGHGRRQVDGHRRLADTTLAGGDRIHAGQRAGSGEGDLLVGLAATQLGPQRAALLLAHDVERHVDRRDTGDRGQRVGDVAGQRLLHRAARHGEEDRGRHPSGVVDVDGLDHAELGDGFADLGVVDLRERGQQLVPGRQHGGRHIVHRMSDRTTPRTEAQDLSGVRSSNRRPCPRAPCPWSRAPT